MGLKVLQDKPVMAKRVLQIQNVQQLSEIKEKRTKDKTVTKVTEGRSEKT